MASKITLHGIKNCDSCRKARQWLDEHKIEYHFNDVREDGISIQMLERWGGRIDWLKLLNKKSTTWRQLPDDEKDDLDKSRALAMILKHPTLLKRPLLECDQFIAVGFRADTYHDSFYRSGLI